MGLQFWSSLATIGCFFIAGLAFFRIGPEHFVSVFNMSKKVLFFAMLTLMCIGFMLGFANLYISFQQKDQEIEFLKVKLGLEKAFNEMKEDRDKYSKEFARPQFPSSYDKTVNHGFGAAILSGPNPPSPDGTAATVNGKGNDIENNSFGDHYKNGLNGDGTNNIIKHNEFK